MGIRSVVPILAVLMLAGCGSSVPAPPTAQPAGAPAVRVAETVATGLDVPWGIAFLPDGSALVSERDTARILRVSPGTTTTVGMVDGVVPGGEGGLLGIAYADGWIADGWIANSWVADGWVADGWIYAYFTAAEDNRVVRMAWDGAGLGAVEEILGGIPKSGIHNGGRIAFGPDGMLYIATGDAGNRDAAQDPASPAGKILRVNPDGSVPADNPLPGSPVFSLGHRNIQGLAFDTRDRLWASEFGQADVDELNLITAGSNYGWPECEGACGNPAYVDPVVEWEPTSIASPSGIAIVGDFAYVASLRGQTVWQVPLDRSGQATRLDLGDLGRLRTIAAAPGGSLWLSTSNTDGRGDPRGEDDRILRLTVA